MIRRVLGTRLLGYFAAGTFCSVGILAGGCGDDIGESTVSGGGASGKNAGGTGALVGGTSGIFGGAGGMGGSDGGQTGPCKNLQCQQTTCTLGNCVEKACTGGASTTVSGTVFDPSGTLPLYNVIVYVPNAAVDPIVNGASCEPCEGVSGSPVVSALTDTKGQFVLKDVPVGTDIPLVIQIGKWRRQIRIPTVPRCTDTPLTDASQTRLPGRASEGDMPRIALTTGNADALECLLRKIGIDASEFTPESGTGHVNLYAGYQGTNRYDASMAGGVPFTAAQNFWNSTNTLNPYDIVILSCEGEQHPEIKGPAAYQALYDYANRGGRVFMSHWHNVWLEDGPAPFPTAGTFNHQSDIGDFTADIDTTFPKGQAMADWLLNNGGSTTLGKILINDAQHTLDAENPQLAQRWIYSTTPTSVQYLSANTPMGAPNDQLCGRIVFSDIHVSTGDESNPNRRFPTGCTTTGYTPQEKALIFMLFDLSACITPDDEKPVPPPVR